MILVIEDTNWSADLFRNPVINLPCPMSIFMNIEQERKNNELTRKQ